MGTLSPSSLAAARLMASIPGEFSGAGLPRRKAAARLWSRGTSAPSCMPAASITPSRSAKAPVSQKRLRSNWFIISRISFISSPVRSSRTLEALRTDTGSGPQSTRALSAAQAAA